MRIRIPAGGLSLLFFASCLASKEPPPESLVPPVTELPDPRDCSRIDPGRPSLHRLNRAEYDNTVRDLLDDDTGPAADFPADDHGFGFDNIADVLAMSPLLFEKYQISAENLVTATLARPFEGPMGRRFEAEITGSEQGAAFRDWGWNLYVNGEITATFRVDTAGEYEVAARAFGQQAGAEPARMELRIDGNVVQTFDVRAVEAGPEIYRVRRQLAAGAHTLTAAFINDFYMPENPEGDRDRNLVVDWIEYSGPHDFTAEDPERRARVMVCDPAASSREDCARQIFAAFGQRAWRRPLTAPELDRLVRLAGVAWAEEDPFDTGIALGLEAMLSSPHFVYRVELDPQPESLTPHPLTGHELASRLSYFLWSSMPDQELFTLAAQDRLSDPEVLAAQVRRMLQDEKAEALVENFGGQWLYVRGLDDVNPDYAFFPTWDDELSSAMRGETSEFFRTFLREDRSALSMFDADFTFLNDRLAAHYGLPAPGSDALVRVSLTGDQRGGLLTQGSILTVTSHPRRTSPVRRGKWVLEQLLCSSPPPPPPGVEGFPEEVDPTASLRERFEAHRSQETCRGCHESMDAIGFSLENFDAIGAWRTDDSGFDIDARGVLPDGRAFEGPRELAQVIKADPKLPACMVEKAFIYSLGRGPTAHDRCTLEAIEQAFATGGHTFESLFVGVATSKAFTERRGEPVQ